MQRGERGVWRADVADAGPGTRYMFVLPGGVERPDPASRHQPEGVHGPSAVVDPRFAWSDADWRGIPLQKYVIYEMHVGTFTEEGTFDAAARDLQRLRDLGVNAVEVMPVAAFPGSRNWGYDGVFPWAVQESYGGPDGFRRFIDMAHRIGLAVILDVVYNHLGPEGNYLGEFGPYFTDRYRTPWGDAMNFDGAWSDEVRDYFIGSALWFLEEFRVDALRLDAVHAIVDNTAVPFLHDLARAVAAIEQRTGWPRLLIAESDLNDPRLIRPESSGGFGIDAQWSDDFHHALHAVLTAEREGYYVGYGTLEDLATVIRDGWLYQGEFSEYRNRRYGTAPEGVRPEQLVVSLQNHDQIGNRMLGDRLTASLPPEAVRAGLGLLLLAPFTPMLFMGEEWGDTAPFQYFVSHGDPGLIEAVRRGRADEFKAFGWSGEVPDPASVETFERSRLRREGLRSEEGQTWNGWVGSLIGLRSRHPALADGGEVRVDFDEEEKLFVLGRTSGERSLLAIVNFSSDARLAGDHGKGWRILGDSKTGRLDGDAEAGDEVMVPAHSMTVLER